MAGHGRRWLAVVTTFGLGCAGYLAATGPADGGVRHRADERSTPASADRGSQRVVGQGSGPAADRPNIVYLVADDLDLASVAAMPILARKVIDRGVTMSRFFTGFPLCCPSRASMLRGQHAHNTGVVSNGPTSAFPAFHAAGKEASTVATWLQDGGYVTAMMGKYLNFYPKGAGRNYVPPGWDRWRADVRGGPSGFGYTQSVNGRRVRYGDRPRDYHTDVLSAAATRFIRHTEDPFFLYLSPSAPHSPATPAPRHEGMFADAALPRSRAFNEVDVSDKPPWIRDLKPLARAQKAALDALHRKRLQSLQAVDEMVRAVINALKDRGELENTYLVFTSDNGYTLGAHRRGGSKNSLYEEDIHVPFFVRGPGVAAGRTLGHLAANIDLAPTFAEIAGTAPADFVDGRSLLPLWRPNAPAESTWRDALLLEHEPPGPRADAAELGEPGWGEGHKRPWRVNRPVIPSSQGVRTDRYVYVEYATGERELYDLLEDPAELHNLAARADPALVARLAATLDALRNCRAQQCRDAEEWSRPGILRGTRADAGEGP